MRFTTQMRAEIETIQKLIHHINKEFLGPMVRPSSAEGTGQKGVFKYSKVSKNEAFMLCNSLRSAEKNIRI